MSVESLPVDKPAKPTTNGMLGLLRRNKWIWKFVGLGLSVFIAVYLLKQIDFKEFSDMVRAVPVGSLVLAFLIYMLLNFSRALRFRLLLGQQNTPIRLMYPIALYHNFLVRTLPFKTGELSYIVMLRTYLNQPIREGVGSLLSARLFDLLLVASGCTLGILTATSQLATQSHLIFTLFIPVLAISAIALYFAGPILRQLIGLGQTLTKRGSPSVARFSKWAAEKLTLVAGQFERIREPRFFFSTILLSACIYASSAMFNLVLLWAIGVQQNLGTLLIVVSIAMFAEALPFSIAGLGLVEGGWTFGLVAFAGLTASNAASIGFFLHACQLLSVALSGLIGYSLLQLSSRAARQTAVADQAN
ncbi:MAG: lysylphosphatidylglycerol synthase transmembrane domain-containing protein [Chloroflexota bacterium]